MTSEYAQKIIQALIVILLAWIGFAAENGNRQVGIIAMSIQRVEEVMAEKIKNNENRINRLERSTKF